MKTRMLMVVTWAVAVGLSGATGCGSERLNPMEQPLDEDGDGFCDDPGAMREEPPLQPVQLALYQAPVALHVRLQMAEGASPPLAGRIAWLVYVSPLSGEETTQQLLFDTELPPQLPADLVLELPRPPQELLDLVRIPAVAPEPIGGDVINAGEARLGGPLVVYDARGSLSFESDIEVIYLDNGYSFEDPSVRLDGYQLALTEHVCREKTRTLENGDEETCVACWSGITRGIDPAARNDIIVDWSSGD